MKTTRTQHLVAVALLALAAVSLAVAAPGDAPAFADGEPGAAEISLALKLHNPIADLVTVPIGNDFEFGSGSRRPTNREGAAQLDGQSVGETGRSAHAIPGGGALLRRETGGGDLSGGYGLP